MQFQAQGWLFLDIDAVNALFGEKLTLNFSGQLPLNFDSIMEIKYELIVPLEIKHPVVKNPVAASKPSLLGSLSRFLYNWYGLALAYGRGWHCAMVSPQTLKIKKCINSIRQWRN